ncbi:hypothetical protein RBE51_20125 [Pseudomonas taiwanensis]|uniref:hypothetical protein n=1 Tax=Pseudomonas taiwanensis TaxID=470150 RepID=UPI0028DE8D31|nr:hypothetical protein [Pseudomonas taiwanensis]MDT8925101.1 hypothetical protein [Pseudomonas taiwanensis]
MNKKSSLFMSLAFGLLTFAPFSIQASNEIRITAPIPEAAPERWIDATMRGSWRDVRTGCSWDPPSSSVAYTAQVNQTGTCGVTQAREVRPLERSTKTGILRETAPPYDEFQVTNPFYKTRTVYGDFTGRMVAQYKVSNGTTYMGARQYYVGTPAPIAIAGFVSAGFTMEEYSWQPGKYVGVLNILSSNGQTSAAWGSRYSHIDILGQSGNVLSTYTMPLGGAVSGNESRVDLRDWESQLKLPALWSVMQADIGAVTGFRVYNPKETSE